MSVPRIPRSGGSFKKKDFVGFTSESPIHPIALGQAPLLDYDHQLISLATG
jgi:hypothetical protein